MVALLSCLLVSVSLAFRDPNIDLHTWNVTEIELPMRSKSVIANFSNRSSIIFIIDALCLVWAIIEITLRVLSAPSLYVYLSKIGLFDIIGKLLKMISKVILSKTLGVMSHLIYTCTHGTRIKPRFDFFFIKKRNFNVVEIISRCRENPIPAIDMFDCIAFNRRLMILNLFRKVRLVRYIRPLNHLILSLIASKREVLRLIVLILFILAFLGPIIFIIESSHIHECKLLKDKPNTRCIRTINDAFYFLILIVSTVG